VSSITTSRNLYKKMTPIYCPRDAKQNTTGTHEMKTSSTAVSAQKECLFGDRASPDAVRNRGEFISKLPLEIFIDALPDIFLILNQHGQIVLANKGIKHFKAAKYGKRLGEVLNCVHAYEKNTGCGTTQACHNCGIFKAVLSSLQGHNCVQTCRIITRKGRREPLDVAISSFPLSIGREPFSACAIKYTG